MKKKRIGGTAYRSNCSESPRDTAQASEYVQDRLIAALMDGQRYPHAAKHVRLIETHISWVLLAGVYAYKIKKAVDLGFLNFTRLESRRFFCEEELRLNRRLAPELYLDVVPIGGVVETPRFGALPPIEYAVRMRRFPVANELDKLAVRGKLTPQHIDALAATLAAFHRNLPALEADSLLGSPWAIRSTVFQVLHKLESLLKESGDAGNVDRLKHACEQEYQGNETYLGERHAKGFVRECHGDLHLGNIVLTRERPVPFDCIEFDPALRWIDVMNEISFTVMDLLHFQLPALAYRLLNAYLENTGDYEGVRLLPFYSAYRAAVRSMVNAIRATQPGLPTRARQDALGQCRNFITLAQDQLSRRAPALIITHGLPGSGKTFFAQAALERFQAVRIRSDVERKRLFGLERLAKGRAHSSDIYSPDATRLTYGHLLELSEKLLAAGARVIVDAAFLKRDERESFRHLAHEMQVPFVIASLKASPAILRARLTRRQAAGNDASEADLEVLEKLRLHQQALTQEESRWIVEFVNEGNRFSDEVDAWQKLEQRITQDPTPEK